MGRAGDVEKGIERTGGKIRNFFQSHIMEKRKDIRRTCIIRNRGEMGNVKAGSRMR